MRPWERRGGGGELSSSRANSRRVNTEWADRKGRGGGGGPGENGSVEKLAAGSALPVPAGPEPCTGLPEAESPRGGGGAGGKGGRDTGQKERGRSLPLVRESG